MKADKGSQVGQTSGNTAASSGQSKQAVHNVLLCYSGGEARASQGLNASFAALQRALPPPTYQLHPVLFLSQYETCAVDRAFVMQGNWSAVVQYADPRLSVELAPGTSFGNNPPIPMLKQLYALHRCAQIAADLGSQLGITFDVGFRLRSDHTFGDVRTPNFSSVFSNAWPMTVPANARPSLLPANTLQVPDPSLDFDGLQDRLAWGSADAFFCTNSRFQYLNKTKLLHGESFHKFAALSQCNVTLHRVHRNAVDVSEVPHAAQRCHARE
ncbi:MAG: hypothetical protein EOO65_05050 [Methanosarcinales archaeon]|nr:MAG: hypothetical protein EOO65_05050 [Methanosarcinales archaeon]